MTTEMDEQTQRVLERIRRAEQKVATVLVRSRAFYPRVKRTPSHELLGYERDLLTEPLTEAEGQMLLTSSLASASDSVLHLLYQGPDGMSIRRMCALIQIVETTGRHEFARETQIHAAIRAGHWPTAARLLTAYMLKRGMTVEMSTELAEQIRHHNAGAANAEAGE